MALIDKITRYQRGVYFAPTASNGYGRQGWAAPVEIGVRWEDKQKQYINPAGVQVVSNANVYVDQDVLVGGYLWLGTLADLPDDSDPRKNLGCFEVMQTGKLPNKKAKKFLREAFL